MDIAKGGTEEHEIMETKTSTPDLSPRSESLSPHSGDKMTPAELRRAFQALTERLDQIEAEITALRDGLSLAATQPQATPASAGQTVNFVASILLVGVDDNGLPTYKAKGGQYMKFGVRVWPEILPELGINPASLKPGPNPINLHVLALMGEKGPRKVIGLVK
jgi:hypothetical protein